MAAAISEFGPISLGSYREITFTFLQGITPQTPDGTPTEPSGGVFVNLTPPRGVKTSYAVQLVHKGAGAYMLPFVGTIAGTWTGTVYAGSGTGQEAQPFRIEVDPDPNYP